MHMRMSSSGFHLIPNIRRTSAATRKKHTAGYRPSSGTENSVEAICKSITIINFLKEEYIFILFKVFTKADTGYKFRVHLTCFSVAINKLKRDYTPAISEITVTVKNLMPK